jgi:3-oxoacyl-[acyl-carrier-protein] synthase II
VNERIVVSGAGVIASIGAGWEEFAEAIYRGESGLRTSAVVDLEDSASQACEVADFTPQRWLGPKGVRALDRSARLLAVAAQMALESVDRVTPEGEEGDPGLGLVCGTIFGSVHSIASFDWSGLEDGVKYVNPMAFPNTVINSPAGQAAIKHRLRGVNSTISAGLASSLYAIDYAADFLRFGRASMLLAGGVEEIAEESYLGFRKNGLLSQSNRSQPFSQNRDGVVLGEGSALFALESAERAAERGASILAEVVSFGSFHDAHSIDRYSVSAEGAVSAIRSALDGAGIEPASVSFIVSGASGSRGGDHMELEALRRVFGPELGRTPICCPKASLGETLGASGALATAVALTSFERGLIPPTAGADSIPEGLLVSREAQPVLGDWALITGFSCDGNNAALILRRWRG